MAGKLSNLIGGVIVALALSPPSHAQQATPPTSCAIRFSDPEPINPGRWIDADNYPARALRDGAEGRVGVRLYVDVQGRVESVEIEQSSGNADLDAATIQQLTRRARFRPATRNCVPVPGEHTRTVTWALPQ